MKQAPSTWLSFGVKVQCLDCGTVIEADIENPQPEALEALQVAAVKCPTCSSGAGVDVIIPVCLLVGEQVDTYTEESP